MQLIFFQDFLSEIVELKRKLEHNLISMMTLRGHVSCYKFLLLPTISFTSTTFFLYKTFLSFPNLVFTSNFHFPFQLFYFQLFLLFQILRAYFVFYMQVYYYLPPPPTHIPYFQNSFSLSYIHEQRTTQTILLPHLPYLILPFKTLI